MTLNLWLVVYRTNSTIRKSHFLTESLDLSTVERALLREYNQPHLQTTLIKATWLGTAKVCDKQP